MRCSGTPEPGGTFLGKGERERGGKRARIEDRGWQSVLEMHAILDHQSSILKKSPFLPLPLSPFPFYPPFSLSPAPPFSRSVGAEHTRNGSPLLLVWKIPIRLQRGVQGVEHPLGVVRGELAAADGHTDGLGP